MDELIEQLTTIIDDDHDRGCQMRFCSCSCGFDDNAISAAKDARLALTRQREEIAALVKALEPFVDLRAQTGAWGIIQKAVDGMAPMSVTVTKAQMLAAFNALAQHKERNSAG